MSAARWTDALLIFLSWLVLAGGLCVAAALPLFETYGRLAPAILLFVFAIGFAGGIANAIVISLLRSAAAASTLQRVVAVSGLATLLTLAWMVPLAAYNSQWSDGDSTGQMVHFVIGFVVAPLLLVSLIVDRMAFSKSYLALVRARQ